MDLTALPSLSRMVAALETKNDYLNNELTSIEATLGEVTSKMETSSNLTNEARVQVDLLYTMWRVLDLQR